MDQLSTVLAAIERLASDPRARIFGIADPLRAVGKVLEAQQRDTAAVASAVLRMHYNPGEPLRPAEYDACVRIAGAGIEHREHCPCMACFIKRAGK